MSYTIPPWPHHGRGDGLYGFGKAAADGLLGSEGAEYRPLAIEALLRVRRARAPGGVWFIVVGDENQHSDGEWYGYKIWLSLVVNNGHNGS